MSKIFQDDIHGPIELSLTAVKIIDTPEFQRLRNIKQLGSAYYIFPSASHNRFEHSIGVAHLARSLINEISRNQPELGITDEQRLNVELAGLCHDLGHGPFSHIYDDVYLRSRVSETHRFRHHEARSCEILARINRRYGIGLSDENLLQIQRMIHPVTVEEKKNFLYQIVSNGKNGIDVDKFDYIARDSRATGIYFGFDHRSIFIYCRVIDNELCYCDEVIFNIFQLFETRYRLHMQVYSHLSVKRVDMMMELLFEQFDYFLIFFREQFAGDDLSNFLRLTDSLLDYPFLVDGEDEHLVRAREIILNLRERKLTPILDEVEMKTGEKFEDVKMAWLERNGGVSQEDYQFCLRKLSFSAGTRNPLNYVKFYRKDTGELLTRREIKSKVGNILPRTFEENYLIVFRKTV